MNRLSGTAIEELIKVVALGIDIPHLERCLERYGIACQWEKLRQEIVKKDKTTAQISRAAVNRITIPKFIEMKKIPFAAAICAFLRWNSKISVSREDAYSLVKIEKIITQTYQGSTFFEDLWREFLLQHDEKNDANSIEHKKILMQTMNYWLRESDSQNQEGLL